MGLREEKQTRLRNLLLDTAEALFRKNGFDETRIEHIAEIAGVSRQTFFNYFQSKEMILYELGVRWLTNGIRSTQKRLSSGRSTKSQSRHLDKLRRSVRLQARDIEADREFMTLVYTRSGVMGPQGKPHPNNAERLKVTRRGFETLALPFRQAQASGEIRTDADPLQLAEMLFALQTTTTRLWLLNYWNSQQRLETRVIKAFDLLVDGLRGK